MPYEVRRYELIAEWLEQNADNELACRRMAKWLDAAITGPDQMADGVWRRADGKRLFYAGVPGTGAIVTYFVGKVPGRIMTINSIIPAP